MGLMSEREDEGEVDEKLHSPTERLAGTAVRLWVEDWDVVKSGRVYLGSSEMGLSTMEELRWRDQIDDGFERRDQTGEVENKSARRRPGAIGIEKALLEGEDISVREKVLSSSLLGVLDFREAGILDLV
nr:hypothetical protein CFP56_39331 [Quercus suber]